MKKNVNSKFYIFSIFLGLLLIFGGLIFGFVYNYKTFNNIITYILIVICFAGGIIFSFFFKAYNLNVKRIYKTLKGSAKKAKDGISGLQALMLSTASRIGNGNIAGVSSAIMLGGPGALFWMWVTAFLGMSTAFAEGTLSQVYKQKWANTYVGGTPFYIAKKSGSKILKIIAGVYAIFAIFTFGSSYAGIQSNTIANNFSQAIGENKTLSSETIQLMMGILLAIIIFAVTIKGIKSIGKFTEFVMPIMGILYLIVALAIIFLNIGKTSEVYELIFKGAFGTKQIIGGIGGYSVIKAIQLGVRRGIFSNEAGIGSASFSAASSNSKHPVQQGLLQSLSTFLDTIIICSASGFIILYSGIWETKDETYNTGLLIKDSIASNFGGKTAEWLVFISIFLFGTTTSIGLYFYAETALKYLTNKKFMQHILKLLICGFLIYSAVEEVDVIWRLETIGTFVLVGINVPFMLTQIKIIKNLIVDYKTQVSLKKPIEFQYDCDKPLIKTKL